MRGLELQILANTTRLTSVRDFRKLAASNKKLGSIALAKYPNFHRGFRTLD